TDISTGKVWYSEYREMLAADDAKPETLATMHPVKIRWNDTVYETMFPIAERVYHERGGTSAHLPGRALISGDGRADAHVAVDGAGELYIFTKTDGVIRSVTGAETAPRTK